MKKLYLTALAVFTACSMLSGCAKTTAETTAAATTEAASSEAETTAVSESAETPTTITVTHELGTAEVPVNPKKIVVLDYSILDTIDFLGAEPEIMLPKSNIPDYLSKYEADTYADAGSLKEPDMEKINEFKPDLIIIGARQASLYSEFEAIAPTVYSDMDYTNYWENLERLNLMTGEIFGQKEAAEEKLADLKTKAEEIKTKAEGSGKKALIILTNDGSVSAYGPGSRFGIIHDVLGFEAVDTTIESSTHGMEIGFEYIAEKNPDILFVVDRTTVVGGTNEASQTLNNDLVNGTTAAKDGKIIYLDPGTWYLSGYGLESASTMFDEVASALN